MRHSFRAVLRGRGTLLLALAALGSLVLSSVATSAAALAATTGTGERACHRPVPDARILAPRGRVAAGEAVGFTLVGHLDPRDCPARTFTMQLPRQLDPVRQAGSAIDARGARVGRVISHRSGRITVKLRREPTGDAFAGSFAARVRYAVAPDTRLELRWRLGSSVVESTLRTARCQGCLGPRTRAGGRALLNGDTVRFTLESVRSRQAREHVRFGAHLDKTLRVRCKQVTAQLARNRLGRWGQLRPVGRLRLHDLRCRRDHALFNRGGTVVTGWVRVPRAHRYAVLSVRAEVRGVVANRYPIWGTTGQRHHRSGIAVAARRYPSLTQPSVDAVPEPRATSSASATPTPAPRQAQHASSAPGRDQRGPVVATTVAILAAGLVALAFRLRRRSS